MRRKMQSIVNGEIYLEWVTLEIMARQSAFRSFEKTRMQFILIFFYIYFTMKSQTTEITTCH